MATGRRQDRTERDSRPIGRRAGFALPLALPDVSRRGLVRSGATAAGVLGLLMGPGGAVAAWAANRATGMRLGEHSAKTRIVFDLAAEPGFRVFTMADPARLVIDLLDADWLVPAGRLPGPTGHVGAVRHGLLDGGVTRIVLDLQEPVSVAKAFALSPRDGHDWRLVVDVADTSARAFRAGAGIEQALVRSGPAPTPTPTAAPHPLAAPAVSPTAAGAPPASPTPAVATPAGFAPIPGRKPPAPMKPVIVLDPGHGGRDPGAISVGGLYEKDITLTMASELRKVLAGTGRYRVVMTRDRDVSVRLRERVRRARQAGADLFLSVHADAIGNRGRARPVGLYAVGKGLRRRGRRPGRAREQGRHHPGHGFLGRVAGCHQHPD